MSWCYPLSEGMGMCVLCMCACDIHSVPACYGRVPEHFASLKMIIANLLWWTTSPCPSNKPPITTQNFSMSVFVVNKFATNVYSGSYCTNNIHCIGQYLKNHFSVKKQFFVMSFLSWYHILNYLRNIFFHKVHRAFQRNSHCVPSLFQFSLTIT